MLWRKKRTDYQSDTSTEDNAYLDYDKLYCGKKISVLVNGEVKTFILEKGEFTGTPIQTGNGNHKFTQLKIKLELAEE